MEVRRQGIPLPDPVTSVLHDAHLDCNGIVHVSTETRAAGGFEDEAVLSVDISGPEKAAADEGRQQEHEGGEETTDNVMKAEKQTKAAVFPRGVLDT